MYIPFLRQVASYFHGKENVQDYCFVLPNHRSCKFFERELDLTSSGAFLMPEVMPVSDFVGRLSGSVPVNQIDALFLLYKCYTSLAGNEDYPFDKFVYWGNVLLNDFNDVDMYLVDPKEIFMNVREHRELQSNYVDSDLQHIMSQYFNLSPVGQAGSHDDENGMDFWRNYSPDNLDNEKVRASYLRLWQSMLELYQQYNAELENRGVKSMGRIYRDAVDAVKDGRDLGHRCYVFVGFNMLSTSEMAIFKRLGDQGKAMYFWDTASPAFDDKYPENLGGRYVKFFKKQFSEPQDFIPEKIDGFPAVKVIGVPSNVGQAKCAFSLIEELIAEKKIIDTFNAINTAIVLPDEALFIPLLNSLSPKIPNINVTMGYPLSDSDIASLMRVVAKMHRRARRDGEGQWTFFRNDVKVVLSHPIVKSCFGEEALAMIQRIDADNVFAVPDTMLEGTPFEMLFHTVEKEDDSASVVRFLRQLTQFAQLVQEKIVPSSSKPIPEEEDDDKTRGVMTIQEAFLNQYIEVLHRVVDAVEQYSVPPCENTVFFLVDKLASVFSLPFEGEPLHGMQVMGMLETRCLDFDNIIIMSANERVLPRKFRSSSFITDFMRRGYGMSTVDDQESMWSYYFYRLIGRAQSVYMLYDTSAQSVGSGEVSRFVPQLKMVYGCDVKKMRLTMSVPTSEEVKIDVPKQDHVAQVIENYRPGGNKSLSASAINEYINCKLAFYFRHIEGLNADNTEADFMDYSTFGTIVHNTLQQLYYPDVDGEERTGEYKVTGAMIKEFKDKHLKDVICRMVNSEYGNKSKPNSPLSGEASIVSVAIELFVKSALNYDLKLLAGDTDFFTVLECERRHRNIVLEFGGEKFNFTYTADRIDRLTDGTLRMVDYKTGKDETSFITMDDLFTRYDKRRKAILQLMLYCNAYAVENNYSGPIKPVIYTIADMSKTGLKYKVDKQYQDFDNYLDVNEEFKACMAGLMHEFFDMSEPFSQTQNRRSDITPCRYCKFVDFCRR
jgi:RecB family exonuclease